ncbi:MAG: hypothetical protein Q4G42_03865 [Neisseria sp.]|nr:hypothetical protein [Neisseria sp.]
MSTLLKVIQFICASVLGIFAGLFLFVGSMCALALAVRGIGIDTQLPEILDNAGTPLLAVVVMVCCVAAFGLHYLVRRYVRIASIQELFASDVAKFP